MASALPIAVTGGIASGKSEVTRRFEEFGIPVLDADLIARELVEPGEPALAEVVHRFGRDVLAADGRLDRRRLRGIVFSDVVARRELEAILHPRVRDELRSRAIRARGPYVLLAIPLLVESGRAYDWLARVLVVDVPIGLQLQRVMRRDSTDEAGARAVIGAQASRTARLGIATDVIVNDDSLRTLDATVERVHRFFLQRSADPIV